MKNLKVKDSVNSVRMFEMFRRKLLNMTVCGGFRTAEDVGPYNRCCVTDISLMSA